MISKSFSVGRAPRSERKKGKYRLIVDTPALFTPEEILVLADRILEILDPMMLRGRMKIR
jgi:hypothetical protein